MKRKLALFVLAAAALGCGGQPDPGWVEGRVLWGEKGIGSALVGAYPKAEQDPATPPVAEAGSRPDGGFRLELPPGRYWLWARATLQGEGRSARLTGRATGNPLQIVSGRNNSVTIPLADASGFSSAAGPAGTGVRGKIAGRDGEAGRVLVSVYPGERERPVGPGFLAARPPGRDGAFQIDVPPGRYTLTARWRASGTDVGDLSPGDRVATAIVEVTVGRYADAGTLVLRAVDPVRLRSVSKGSPKTSTVVSGRVVDLEGKGVEGMRVLAFRDSRMAGKPLALSAATGPQGLFVVYLPGEGVYFLGARSRLGGPAEPGEKVGAFRGAQGSGMAVAAGEVKGGVEMKVEEVW